MSNERISPTPAQQRLVNIGVLIQFHLAAIGHLVVWLWMLITVIRTPTPIHLSDAGYDSWFIASIFVGTGIPISFGILVAVYILFRCLLAYANLGTALTVMITFNVLHASIMGLVGLGLIPLFLIVPLRLAIPTILYYCALRSYNITKINIANENARPSRQPTSHIGAPNPW